MSETSSRPPVGPAGAAGGGAAIHELLKPFVEEAASTRLAIQERNRRQQRINGWLVGLVVVATAILILILAILMQNRQRSAETRALISDNAKVSDQIADCTAVTGVCYQQSQSRLKVTIEQLIESNKAIAVCAKTTDTEAELDACVRTRLTPAPAPTR